MVETVSHTLASLATLLAEGRTPLIVLPDQGLGDALVPALVGAPEGTAEVASVRVPIGILLDRPDELRDLLAAATPGGADLVLLVPPLGRRDDRRSRHDMSELAARNLTAASAPNVDLALVLPAHSISGGGRAEQIMGEIVAGRHVATVLEFHASSLLVGVHHAVRLCILLLTTAEPERVVFLSIPTNVDVDLAREIEELRSGRTRSPCGYSLKGPIDAEGGFLPSHRDPERARRVAEAQAIGELRPLGELCEVLNRLRPTVRPDEQPEPGHLPVLSAKNIGRNGTVGDDVNQWLAPTAGPVLRPGDLVLRSFYDRDRSIVVAEIAPEDPPMIAGRNVIVLRPKSGLRPSERRVLRHFIGSTRFALQLRSQQMGPSMKLNTHELVEAKVPLPDADLMTAFEAVESAADAFEIWRDQSLELLESSLDADDLVEARAQLIASSNRLRQRAAAARLLDDLGHRVSTRFPLPVAYRWRSALAARGSPNETRAVLHAQEVLLAYLAAMTLISAQVAGVEVGHVKDIRQRLSRRRGGLTLGDWRAILVEAAETKAFRRLPATHPFAEVREFFGNPRVTEASSRLTDLRNDVSHLREFAPGELEGTIKQAWLDLETLLIAAEFVTEYPLIRVTETRWDSLEERNTISYRNLAGDSPVVPLSKMTLSSNTIESGSLYLMDTRHDLHLLRPLMIGTDCPSCGHWSTFLPDRVHPDGTVEYKSLEHGHPFEASSSVARSLAAIGLIEEQARGD